MTGWVSQSQITAILIDQRRDIVADRHSQYSRDHNAVRPVSEHRIDDTIEVRLRLQQAWQAVCAILPPTDGEARFAG